VTRLGLQRAAMFAAFLCLFGCHRMSVGTAPSSAWGPPHELRIGRIQDPATLNPLFAPDQATEDLCMLWAEPLVGIDGTNHLTPVVAQRIPSRSNGDISADGLTLTYHLRRDERFADGEPLTSRDVAFTYRAIMDRRNPVPDTHDYQEIVSLVTPDPYTVRIRLRKPWAAAVAELFAAGDDAYGIIPAHAFGDNSYVARASWNKAPFGSGPFRVVEWRHGDQIVLEPNQYALRKPRLHRLIFKIIPDYTTLLVALRTHDVDVYAGVDETHLPILRSLPGVRLVRTPLNYVEFLEFNTQRAPTDDLRVRRSVMEAIDKTKLLKTVYMSLRTPANTEIAPVLWAHDPDVRSVSFDPTQASKDLDAAGWVLRHGIRLKGDRPLELVFVFNVSDSQQLRLATEVQAQLRAVGVAVGLKGYPLALMLAPVDTGGVLAKGLFNIDATGILGASDPEASELFTCDKVPPNGQNYSRFCNAAYDREYALQRIEQGQSARRQAFFAMQQILHDDYAYDFINYASLWSAINPNVRNWHPNMAFFFWNSYEWDVP